MPVRILAWLIHIESMMGVLDQGHTHAATCKVCNHLFDQRGFSAAGPSSEAEYSWLFLIHTVPRLSIFKRRLALFNERAHAFLLVFKCKRCMKFTALKQQALGKRSFECGVNCLFDFHDGR